MSSVFRSVLWTLKIQAASSQNTSRGVKLYHSIKIAMERALSNSPWPLEAECAAAFPQAQLAGQLRLFRLHSWIPCPAAKVGSPLHSSAGRARNKKSVCAWQEEHQAANKRGLFSFPPRWVGALLQTQNQTSFKHFSHTLLRRAQTERPRGAVRKD